MSDEKLVDLRLERVILNRPSVVELLANGRMTGAEAVKFVEGYDQAVKVMREQGEEKKP